MYCIHKEMVHVVCKDGSKMTLANIFCIPRLGEYLLSGKRICQARLTGQLLNYICTLNIEKIRLL
jgi:hypothetical protein